MLSYQDMSCDIILCFVFLGGREEVGEWVGYGIEDEEGLMWFVGRRGGRHHHHRHRDRRGGTANRKTMAMISLDV